MRLVLVACALLAACNARHDPTKQLELLRGCIHAHSGMPEGTVGEMDIKGGIIVYCENFADVNSIVEDQK